MLPVDQTYLDLVARVLREGEPRPDRTGTGTRSVFGVSVTLPLDPFPLVSVKRTFYRGVFEELRWMLRGSTNARELDRRGIKIWNVHGSRTFLDAHDLPYSTGELGPVYGYQWRHWGGAYPVRADDEGVDQIRALMHGLRTDPFGRRHLLTAWNVAELGRMALPPCHVLAQFYVHANRTLSCHLYQRSVDVGLGLPFNWASYATLTHLMAHGLGLGVGQLHVSMGDVHVYETHVDALQTLVDDPPDVRDSRPTLRILGAPKEDPVLYAYDDLAVLDYAPGPAIVLPMAA